MVVIFYSFASKCNACFIANVFTVCSAKKIVLNLCVGLAHAEYIFMCKAERYLTERAPLLPPPRLHVRCEKPVVHSC